MCGIVGRYNYLSGHVVDADVLKQMCALVAHRGPDGEGLFHHGPVGMGHRRLAVIDLSPAARQPMVSQDEQLCITYNGEIYNFRELRAMLEPRGHIFTSQSDTEVILAAYREYGVKCVDHLRGMFAFGIWDGHQRRLFLARDRVGKKPLYYRCDADGVVFASEPKAFLADPGFAATVDCEAISHYLTYQYVPSPWSAFHGVKKLPPGHVLLVDNGCMRTERYWKLSYHRRYTVTEKDACRMLFEKLQAAVGRRLISDVPLGAFLSGGLDSSVVVGLMAELGVSPLKTFSIGFEQQAYNELSFAKRVAQRFGTDHHEFVVTPQVTDVLPKLVWHYNEPFADSSAIPTFYLAEMTRRHVTVALNGDGGDENLAGYDRYLAHALSHGYDSLPRFMRRGFEGVGRLIPESPHSKTFLNRLKRFVSALGQSPALRYGRWIDHFDPELKAEMCTEEFTRQTNGVDASVLLAMAFDRSDADDFLNATLDVDVNTYLPDDLLVKVDIATMAHGLEARSPFLDQEVMEFCAALPAGMKLNWWTKKYLLKKAVKDLLPSEIVRRPKMGFGVPIDHWLREDLRELVFDVLLAPRAIQRGYFHQKVVERLLNEHVRKVRGWHYQIWNLLMLELWHRMFIDGEWRMNHLV